MKKITKIGKDVVMHSDIMLSNIQDVLQGQKVDMMYSDPPWGTGNLNYWQTMNKKMTGAKKNEVDLDAFLRKIFSIAKDNVKGIVFIEYGIQWRDDIKKMAKQYGLVDNGTIRLQYKSGSKLLPLDLHLFSKKPITIPQSYIKAVTDTYGYNTLKQAMTPFAKEGGTILDACCGMGYTAQLAIDTGMTFYGNELNAKRLQKTINRLEKRESLRKK